MINQRKAGAILSYFNIVTQMAVALIYTPIMLRFLGQSEYGLYSMIGSFVAYLSILDMGLGNTIVRYTAKNRAVGDADSEAKLNGLFLLVYFIIGILTSLIGWGFYLNLENIFGDQLSADEMVRAKYMMIMLVANIAVSFPLSIFASIMQAYERFIFLRIINIARVVIQPLIILPLLMLGYGSVMMVAVSVAVNIACLLTNVYYCYDKLHISFKRGNFEKEFLMEIIGYSFFIFLNAIMDKVYWGSGQFVLGIMSGTVQVAIYAVAMQFMMIYMSISTAVSSVFLPKVTMMVAEKVHIEEFSELMIRIGRIQFLIVGFILAMFIVIGKNFIVLWVGSDYLEVYPIVVLLMSAVSIALIQNIGITLLLAMNLNKWRTIVYTICALISIICSFPMAKYFSGMGCAVCTSMALLISTGLLMNWYYRKKIKLDIAGFWKSIVSVGKFTVIFIGLSMMIQVYMFDAVSWEIFIIQCVMYSIIYVIIMYFFAMNDYEKKLLMSIIDKVRYR